MIRIKSFLDQDSSRGSVGKICGRFALEVLALVDSATAEDFDAGSEEAKRYVEFREWLGPQVSVLAQSCVVGPLLSATRFGEDGVVDIDHTLKPEVVERSDVFSRAGRIRWLLSEIPSLISEYGELYEREEVEASEFCASLTHVDFSLPENRARAEEVHPILENWYNLSQPGRRIFRDDEDAIAAMEKAMTHARGVLKAERERRVAEQKDIDAGLIAGEKSSDAENRLNFELESIDEKMFALSREIEILSNDRDRVLDDLEFAEEVNNAS